MTGGQITITVIEVLAVVVLIIAILNESKIAKWEEKLFYNIKRKLSIKRRK